MENENIFERFSIFNIKRQWFLREEREMLEKLVGGSNDVNELCKAQH